MTAGPRTARLFATGVLGMAAAACSSRTGSSAMAPAQHHHVFSYFRATARAQRPMSMRLIRKAFRMSVLDEYR